MDATHTAKRHRSSGSLDSTPQPPSNKQKMTATSLCKYATATSSRVLPRSKSDQDMRTPISEDIINLNIGTTTRGRWVGPIDPALFLGRLLRRVDGDVARPEIRGHAFAGILDLLERQEIIDSLIIELSRFSQDLKIADSYLPPKAPWDAISIDATEHSVLLGSETNIKETNLSHIEVPLVFRREDDEDPYSDYGEGLDAEVPNRYPFERDGVQHRIMRGQIGSCLTAIAGAQFRLHLFAILICGHYARLLRWDQNGVIVTKKFAYGEEDYLVEFLWRYSHTPPRDPARGHDPTVEAFPLGGCVQSPEGAIARIELAQANQANHFEFRTIRIPDRSTGEENQFIISYPLKPTSHSPFGKLTRAMLAFDLSKNMMVFVKDYWRSVGQGTEKEGDIYALLHTAGVPSIPHFGMGNDVRDHATLTDIAKSEDWALPSAKMDSLRHYRMSLEEIGRPLNKFKSSYELVTAVADAMEAHDIAYHSASILHRDISTGNILINKDGRGMLIDWDLCLNMNGLEGKPIKPERIGTWQFMSSFLLQNDKHVQDVFDDNESSLYVILWNMMRYTPHNRTNYLAKEMLLFEEYCDGVRKADFLLRAHVGFDFKDRPQLNSLLQELCATLSIRYELPIDDATRKFLDTPEAIEFLPMNYVVRERRFGERSWLVRSMRKHLEVRSEWPEADAARWNP